MGVGRWFERKHSDLRGEVKNHLDRSRFSVAASTIRPQIEARGGIAASSAGSCATGSQGCRRPKKSEEGNSSAFFTQKGNAAPCPVCFRRVSNVLESEAFGIVHIKQIGASGRTCGDYC